MSHLFVTNDFPPKVGGIQSYLYELWSRLPPDDFSVLTTAYPGAEAFDEQQTFRIVRSRRRVLLPIPAVMREISAEIAARDPDLVVLDPALPIGLVGPRLARPYAVVLHGAEVTVPGRLPGLRELLASVIKGASLVIAAGGYPAAEAQHAVGAGRMPPLVVVPPGVDCERWRPLGGPAERRAARRRLGLPAEGRLVASVSRLVPRKGMDVLIEATAGAAELYDDLLCVIGGEGRDRRRLERLAARVGAPVRFLGRVSDDDLPVLDAAADVWAMICRNRWFGLEQEGFGKVFLEAAACGVPQLAGRSGGADEAVVDGETGLVVPMPSSPVAVRAGLVRLLGDETLRERMGAAARERVMAEFSPDDIAERLRVALQGATAGASP